MLLHIPHSNTIIRRVKGRIEERFDNAILMIKEFQLAIDDVVQKLNIKKEEL